MQKSSITAPDVGPLGCPICGSESGFIFTSQHQRQVFACRKQTCGHFFTPPLHDADGICERNENIEHESDLAVEKWGERNLRLLGLFKSVLTEARRPYRFLDYGAGNANVSRSFKDALGDDLTIYCLEPNEMCRAFYEKYGLVPIQSLDAAPNDIDLVYLTEVVEHLVDPVSTLKEIKEHLSPCGKIFLSTPHGWHNEGRTNAFATPSHVHFFTARSLNLALRKSGLSEISYRYFPEMHPRPSGMKEILRSVLAATARTVLRPYDVGGDKGRRGIGWPFQLVGFTAAADSQKPTYRAMRA